MPDQDILCFDTAMALQWWEKVERRFEDFEPKMTWSRLAQMTGEHASRMSLWKKGQGLPDLHQVQRIADAIQVPVEYLTREDDAPAAPPVQSVEEKLLLDASRKVGVQKILEVLFAAAVRGMDPGGPREVVLEPTRSVLMHPAAKAEAPSNAKGPGEGSSPRPGPKKK